MLFFQSQTSPEDRNRLGSSHGLSYARLSSRPFVLGLVCLYHRLQLSVITGSAAFAAHFLTEAAEYKTLVGQSSLAA